MDSTQSWIVVAGLTIGTFLIRYSFIGLFANRDLPPWLERSLKLMVPAIFAAIVCSGVVMVTGANGSEIGGLANWPRYAAAAVALSAAIASRGSMLITLGLGMATLHGLPWLVH